MNPYYQFFYMCEDRTNPMNIKEDHVLTLKMCKDAFVINYDHMFPIDNHYINQDTGDIEIRTGKLNGTYGTYLGMPLNECYYYLHFLYSRGTSQYRLEDSSFLQLCSKNGNSTMECIKYHIKRC